MRRARKIPLMAEINIVPYIDVMLVLLIIFMVTAPLVLQGPSVDLPQSNAKPIESKVKVPLVLTLERSGQITTALGSKVLPYQGDAAFTKLIKQTPVVFLRADKHCLYDQVALLLTRLKTLGVRKVNLLTA